VLNHVLLHQTVIGLEAKKQFEKVGDYPDMIFAPCGGGSNFGGAAFPSSQTRLPVKTCAWCSGTHLLPDANPRPLRLRLRRHCQAHTDDADVHPRHDFMPPGIHAGGLRYHGDSALVSQLYHEKLIEAVAVPQLATFQAGVTFARAEASSRRRNQPCHRGLHRRGIALQGERRGEDAVLQPLRPRPLRHGRL